MVLGSSPGGSRGIRSGDGVGEEKLIYLFNKKYKIRLGRNSVVGKLSGENRLNNLVYVEGKILMELNTFFVPGRLDSDKTTGG